eukprot:g16857.t1
MDMEFERLKTFEGVSLRKLLEYIEIGEGEQLVFVATDGYQINFDSSLLLQPELNGLVAFRDLEAPENLNWELFQHGRELVNFDPFYLVWAIEGDDLENPDTERLYSLPWPYQLNEIRVVSADQYAAAAPTAEMGERAKSGFDLYVKHCIKCHQVKGLGGQLGPPIDREHSWASLMDGAVLKDIIWKMKDYVPKTKMPDYREVLSEQEAEDLLAKRNQVEGIPDSIDGIKQMLAGSVLTQFLAGLAKARSVMITEQDFYEVAWDFAVRQMENNVLYTELMFDPQGHTSRGIEFDTLMRGLTRAIKDAEGTLGIRIELSMQFHRDKSRESAFETLAEAERWREHIVGVGMDNGPEAGYAEKLRPVMEKAREMGFEISGHVDRYELDHDKNLDFLLNTLKVGRVDHGINMMDSPHLIPVARDRGVTFTVCGATTYSNQPNLYEDSGFKLYTRRIDEMTEAGLKTTINTDDPGYFIGFYLSDMIRAFYEENQYSREELIDFQRRAFEGAWMPEQDKAFYLEKLRLFALDTIQE